MSRRSSYSLKKQSKKITPQVSLDEDDTPKRLSAVSTLKEPSPAKRPHIELSSDEPDSSDSSESMSDIEEEGE